MVRKDKKKKTVHENKEEGIFDLIEQWTELDDLENLEKLVYTWTNKDLTPKKEAQKIMA